MNTASSSAIVAFIAAFSAAPASAGSIFGTVTEGSSPLKNRQLEVRCPQRSIQTSTDEAGAYRAVVVNFSGRCTLVLDPPQGPTASVVLHADGARFDFVVRNGQLERR
jgi:hypothetical protein